MAVSEYALNGVLAEHDTDTWAESGVLEINTARTKRLQQLPTGMIDNQSNITICLNAI